MHGVPQGQYLFFQQELISEHFGEDGTSYETEIQELEDLRQVGGLLPLLLLQRQKWKPSHRLCLKAEVHTESPHARRKPGRWAQPVFMEGPGDSILAMLCWSGQWHRLFPPRGPIGLLCQAAFKVPEVSSIPWR